MAVVAAAFSWSLVGFEGVNIVSNKEVVVEFSIIVVLFLLLGFYGTAGVVGIFVSEGLTEGLSVIGWQ